MCLFLGLGFVGQILIFSWLPSKRQCLLVGLTSIFLFWSSFLYISYEGLSTFHLYFVLFFFLLCCFQNSPHVQLLLFKVVTWPIFLLTTCSKLISQRHHVVCACRCFLRGRGQPPQYIPPALIRCWNYLSGWGSLWRLKLLIKYLVWAPIQKTNAYWWIWHSTFIHWSSSFFDNSVVGLSTLLFSLLVCFLFACCSQDSPSHVIFALKVVMWPIFW